MRFTAREAKIDFSARNGIHRVVIPVAHLYRGLWIALIDLLEQGIKADQHQRRFRGQHERQPARGVMMEFIEDLIANLHPVGQILLQAHRQRCRQQA